jgi:hypothetical protein
MLEFAPAKLAIRQVQFPLPGCGHAFGITAALGNQAQKGQYHP